MLGGVALGNVAAGMIAAHSSANYGFLLASACVTSGAVILAASSAAHGRTRQSRTQDPEMPAQQHPEDR